MRPPLGTPPRFEEASVYEAALAGLTELGMDVEVSSVDCREFPCIFMGKNFGSREDAEAWRETRAMASYGTDERAVHGWTEGKNEDGTDRWRFAIAVFPRSDGEHDRETHARIGYRVDEARRSATK